MTILLLGFKFSSKNQYYWGKAKKKKEVGLIRLFLPPWWWAFIEQFPAFHVEIVFHVPHNRYARFEPQNYTELIFDAIFEPQGKRGDNKVVNYRVYKHPAADWGVEIRIWPAELKKRGKNWWLRLENF